MQASHLLRTELVKTLILQWDIKETWVNFSISELVYLFQIA